LQALAESSPLTALKLLSVYFEFRLQDRPSTDSERTRIFFDPHYGHIWSDWELMEKVSAYDPQKTSFHALAFAAFDKALALKPQGELKVLVIGTGSGRLGRELLNRGQGRTRIVETDPDPETVLRSFRENVVKRFNTSIRSLPANAANLGTFADGQFDIVVSYGGALRYFVYEV
jgi:SAM-dependent methyltransferase